MLAGQRLAPANRAARYRLAARLAAPIGPPLVHGDGDATIAEFVRCGQSCDATADDDYVQRLSLVLSRLMQFQVAGNCAHLTESATR